MKEEARTLAHPDVNQGEERSNLSGQNLVEFVDRVLHTVAESTPVDSTDRNQLVLSSMSLGEWARSQKFKFDRELVRRRLQKEEDSFEETYSALNRDPGLYPEAIEHRIEIVKSVSHEVAEALLKEVDFLKKDEELSDLETSERWQRSWDMVDRGRGGTATHPFLGGWYNSLPTRIKGLKVAVEKDMVYLPYPKLWTSVYSISCEFDSESMRAILELPITESSFSDEISLLKENKS